MQAIVIGAFIAYMVSSTCVRGAQTQQKIVVNLSNSTQVIKGAADRCTYQSFCMGNGMRVLLMYDPQALSRVSVMQIDAGAEYDKNPGTAHFLEHMLFMGTEKYPREDEYKDFVGLCGGSSNAFTEINKTLYYFAIPASTREDKFLHALHMFAQFFICPLFKAECINREIEAVNSEFLGQNEMDGMHLRCIEAAHANPGHPHSHFLMGNRETLAKDNMRDEIIEFYNSYYCPQNMIFTLYSSRPIEQMAYWAMGCFGAMPARIPLGVQGLRNRGIRPYLPNAFSKVIWVRSTNNARQLTIKYILSEQCLDLRAKPHRYVMCILSYNGDGSLFSALLAKNLITDLSVMFSPEPTYGYGILAVVVALTEEGLSNCRDVVAQITGYIQQLGKIPVVERFIEEDKTIQQSKFDAYCYTTHTTVSNVMEVTDGFRNYGLKRMLSNRFLIEEVDTACVAKFLCEEFRDNFFVTILDPHLAGALITERWTGAEYTVSDLDRVSSTQCATIVFPQANKFVLTGLGSGAAGKKHAMGNLRLLFNNVHGTKLWHRVGRSYSIPRTTYTLVFKTDYMLESTRNRVLADVFCRAMTYVLSRELYSALRVGYSAHVGAITGPVGAIIVRLGGFDEKIASFVLDAMGTIQNTVVDESTLEMARRTCTREIMQWESLPHGQRVSAHREYCLSNRHTTLSERLKWVDHVTSEDIGQCAQNLFRGTYPETFVYGNISSEETETIHREVVGMLGTRHAGDSTFGFVDSHVRLAHGTTTLFHRPVPGTTSSLYFCIQVAEFSQKREQVLMMLFNEMTKTRFVLELRMKEQLGYTVQQSFVKCDAAYLMTYFVQSSEPARLAYTKIVEFIETKTRGIIGGVGTEEFEMYRKSLATQLRQDSNEFLDMLEEIVRGSYDFEGRCALVEIAAQITKEDLVSFWNEHISESNRRGMCVAMISEQRYADDIALLEEMESDGHMNKLVLVPMDAEPVTGWRAVQEKLETCARCPV